VLRAIDDGPHLCCPRPQCLAAARMTYMFELPITTLLPVCHQIPPSPRHQLTPPTLSLPSSTANPQATTTPSTRFSSTMNTLPSADQAEPRFRALLSAQKEVRLKLLRFISKHLHRIPLQSKLKRLALQITNSTALIHLLSITLPFVILSDVLFSEHNLTLFSFHPICMAFGIISLLTQGVIGYKDKKVVGAVSDIMNGKLTKRANEEQRVAKTVAG
jgi:hypothetical protein